MKDIVAFFKFLIIAGVAVALGLVSYVFYDAYMARRIFVPAPPPTAHEIAIAARWVEVWFWVKASLLALVVFALYAAVQRFLMVPALNSRERISYDPQTGMLPLVRRNVAPWWKRVTGHNEYDELDGNLAATPHRKVWSNGRMTVEANTHGIAPESQVEYARGSWGVQSSVARKGRGMSVGEARFASGEFHAKAQFAKERAEIIREKRLASTQPLLPVPAMADPICLADAIRQSDGNNWITGQATELQPAEGFAQVGKLSVFKPRNSHAAIIGGTGSGKTASTGLLFAFYARKFGYHPIVLDGKNGIDWRPLQGIVEWHNMDAESFEWQLQALTAIFAERWRTLEAAGAKTIYHLPADERPVPMLVIFEEFGDIWTEALGMRTKEARQALVQAVNHLFRLCRATGITLCLIDQAPEKWSQQMRGNAKFVACYKLKGGVANAFNEYHADKLPDVGMYSQDNVFYRPWHTEEEIDITRMFPPLGRTLLKRPVELDSSTPPQERNGTGTVETANGEEGGDVRNLPLPPSLVHEFQRSGKWPAFGQKFFVVHEDATQAELRLAMSKAAGGEPIEYKSRAYRLYHRYSPHGVRANIDGYAQEVASA